jgi:hypothetical protein
MKKLKLQLNIGTGDARRLGLEKTRAGETVSVEKEAADEMLSKGWAIEPGQEPPAPPGAPQGPPDLEALTKEELVEFAQAHKVEGVTMAMIKEEIIRTIRRAIRR